MVIVLTVLLGTTKYLVTTIRLKVHYFNWTQVVSFSLWRRESYINYQFFSKKKEKETIFVEIIFGYIRSLLTFKTLNSYEQRWDFHGLYIDYYLTIFPCVSIFSTFLTSYSIFWGFFVKIVIHILVIFCPHFYPEYSIKIRALLIGLYMRKPISHICLHQIQCKTITLEYLAFNLQRVLI